MARDSDNLIAQCEADSSLFDPDALLRRLAILDALDRISHADQPQSRASHLRANLESANEVAYNSIRDQIRNGDPAQLVYWIEQFAGADNPQPGLGYDHLDELISGVLDLREPEIETTSQPPEMVFYQPTPARHILQLIRLSELSAADTLIDLGSGLGHVPILASTLTGAQCIGIEVEPAYLASARQCAASLRLSRVEFIHQNARESDLASGTVFYLYTPFTGDTLSTVLQNLRNLSKRRAITIFTLGPCTSTVAAESWLAPARASNPDQISSFRSLP